MPHPRFAVRTSRAAAGAAALIALGVVLVPAPAAQDAPPRKPGGATPDIAEIRWLLAEVDRVTDELTTTRHELAETELELRAAQRELAELRQFVADHELFGDDFAQYAYVKTAAEEDARRRAAEEARARYEDEKAQRLARRAEARAERAEANAEQDRLDRYARAGFGHVGSDVFTGRMAYRYGTSEGPSSYIDYDPYLGLYYRPIGPSTRIDYSTMTLSGSVINAAETTRHIGIAITFFDAEGSQVGAETVQIENARPDVPYPFTSTLDMALDRPFASVSQYVLYAD